MIFFMNQQEGQRIRLFSIKYKILLILIGMTSVGLGGFFWLSLHHFTQDKTNYLLESSTQTTAAESEILAKEVEKSFEYLQILGESYDVASLDFSGAAKNLFSQQKSIVKAQLIEFQGNGLRRGPLLTKTNAEFALEGLRTSELKEVQKPYLFCLGDDPSRFLFAYRLSKESQQMLIAEIFLPGIKGLADRANYSFALVCPQNVNPLVKVSAEIPSVAAEQLAEKLAGNRSFTMELPLGGTDYLMSGSQIGASSLKLVSFVNKSKAMNVIRELQMQAGLAFVSVLGIICIIALLSANAVTASIEELTKATKRLAGGDFSFEIKTRSRDEVWVLARSFNWMKDKVLDLLEKTKDAARMEAELETATVVQKTLFPAPMWSSDYLQVSGKFFTASECGGDLWQYHETEEHFFLYIGDVVGHGVPSALMTTAARSVTSVAGYQGITSPAEILRLMNNSIFEASKGTMWMTFFIGRLDKKTGQFTYASASHNPPFVFRNREGIRKSDVEILMDVQGPTLGKEKAADYSEAQAQLDLGDLVFFYTDGLTECMNEAKEQLGESKLVRALVKQWNQSKDCKEFCSFAAAQMEEHRAGYPFEDDVTFCALKRLL